ncbi:hypothetical protein D187_009819 [Cystobacter fuscus DSM 2262]|uniref:Uncharacterized protein n=1 Tax=Cystobacter fuscus (strain ATCC 25194 / DSM 2262 / NBRC 100088 / M29) TaxID=1242864 RepID=S9NZB7_CYSF2|nr:hypothetical protein D187_009819 [Cystobacter fuscus DSM 2262]
MASSCRRVHTPIRPVRMPHQQHSRLRALKLSLRVEIALQARAFFRLCDTPWSLDSPVCGVGVHHRILRFILVGKSAHPIDDTVHAPRGTRKRTVLEAQTRSRGALHAGEIGYTWTASRRALRAIIQVGLGVVQLRQVDSRPGNHPGQEIAAPPLSRCQEKGFIDQQRSIRLAQLITRGRPLQALWTGLVSFRGHCLASRARAREETQQASIRRTDTPVVLVFHHDAQPVVPPFHGLGIVGASAKGLGHSQQGGIVYPLIAPGTERPLEGQGGEAILDTQVRYLLEAGPRGEIDGIVSVEAPIASHRPSTIEFSGHTVLVHRTIAIVVLAIRADFRPTGYTAVTARVRTRRGPTVLQADRPTEPVFIRLPIEIIVLAIAHLGLRHRVTAHHDGIEELISTRRLRQLSIRIDDTLPLAQSSWLHAVQVAAALPPRTLRTGIEASVPKEHIILSILGRHVARLLIIGTNTLCFSHRLAGTITKPGNDGGTVSIGVGPRFMIAKIIGAGGRHDQQTE